MRKLQEVNNRVRVIVGDAWGGRTVRCIGPDPTRESAARLMELGVKLEVRGFPLGSGSSSHSITDVDLASPEPFLVVHAAIPATVEINADLLESLSRVHLCYSVTANGLQTLNPLLSVLVEQYELEQLNLTGTATLDDNCLTLLRQMVNLRTLSFGSRIMVSTDTLDDLRRSLPYTSIQCSSGKYAPFIEEANSSK